MCVGVCVCEAMLWDSKLHTGPEEVLLRDTTCMLIPWINYNKANGDLRLLWCVNDKINHSK